MSLGPLGTAWQRWSGYSRLLANERSRLALRKAGRNASLDLARLGGRSGVVLPFWGHLGVVNSLDLVDDEPL